MDPLITYSGDDGKANRFEINSESFSDDRQSVQPFIWSWQESLLVFPLGIIVIGTIIGNFLVLYSAVTRSGSLRLPTHYLIANLALADFLVGVLVMPFLAVLQVTGRWYFGTVYCESWIVIHFWLCSASILSTCGVCIERYIGVRFPFEHKHILSTQRILGMTACIWALAGFLSVTSIYMWPQPKSGLLYVCDFNQQIGHVIMVVVGILYIPAVIMIVLYFQIYILACGHLKFMKRHSSVGTLSISSTDQQQSKGLTFASLFKTNQLQNLQDSFSSDTPVLLSMTRSSEEIHSDLIRPSNQSSDHISTISHKKNSTGSVTSTTTLVSSWGQFNWNFSPESDFIRKKQIQLAKRLSFLVGILLATYLPFFTLFLIRAFYPGSIDDRIYSAFGWIRYFNSCINPFIYAFAVPNYRKEMKDIVLNGLVKLGVAGKART